MSDIGSGDLHLVRLEETGDYTAGVLLINGRMFGYTLEPPWRNNQLLISCIPEGDYTYTITPTQSVPTAKHGCSPLLAGVPKRSGIRLHIGNDHRDTEGCILIGQRIGVIENRRAVLNSSVAFHDLMLTLRLLGVEHGDDRRAFRVTSALRTN